MQDIYTFLQYIRLCILSSRRSQLHRHTGKLVVSVKIELRYFFKISLCYIDSIIVITVLAYITVVAFLLVAYFSIVMLWQDIYRI
jgi:hypothetical protein